MKSERVMRSIEKPSSYPMWRFLDVVIPQAWWRLRSNCIARECREVPGMTIDYNVSVYIFATC
jgi:hypothetical protein